jgi:hypothetical protein
MESVNYEYVMFCNTGYQFDTNTLVSSITRVGCMPHIYNCG